MRGFIFSFSFFVVGCLVAECFGDDAEIARSIQASLSRAKGNGVARDFQLDYSVSEGRVTVTGRCGNSATMRHLVNLMRYTPGVSRVENEIQVTNTSPTLTPMAPGSQPKRGFEKQPMIVRLPLRPADSPGESTKAFQYADEPAAELPPVVSVAVDEKEAPASVAGRPVRFPSFAERRNAALSKGVVQPAEAPAQLPQIVEAQSPRYDRPVQFRSGLPVRTAAPRPVVVATLPQSSTKAAPRPTKKAAPTPPRPPADVPQNERYVAPASTADRMVQPASVSRNEQSKVLPAPRPRTQLQPAPQFTLTDTRAEMQAASNQPMRTEASNWIASAPQTAFEEPTRKTEMLVAALARQPSRGALAVPPPAVVVASDADVATNANIEHTGLLGVADWSQIGWIMLSFAAGVFVVTKLLRAKRS